ncbi:MAG: hypothetical protein H6743_03735 [Rickettsiaceae bacterium]|nr:hypothetical protein [Rickettsiaceae bacterium]
MIEKFAFIYLAFAAGMLLMYQQHLYYLRKHGYIRTKAPFSLGNIDEDIMKDLDYPNYDKKKYDYRR